MSNENFTAEQWIDYFLNKMKSGVSISVDELRNVVKTISVKDPVAARDAVTIFYSGEGSEFPLRLSETAGGEIRMIDRTEACKFLTHRDFGYIVDYAIKGENEAARKDPEILKSVRERVLYPGSEGSVAEGTWEASDGFWSIVSRRFASETSGDAYALVSNALPDRIFATDELKLFWRFCLTGRKSAGLMLRGELFRAA